MYRDPRRYLARSFCNDRRRIAIAGCFCNCKPRIFVDVWSWLLVALRLRLGVDPKRDDELLVGARAPACHPLFLLECRASTSVALAYSAVHTHFVYNGEAIELTEHAIVV